MTTINKYITLLSIVMLSLTLQGQTQHLDLATPPDPTQHASSTNNRQGDIYYIRQLPSGEYTGVMFDIEGNEYPVATFKGTWWTTWNMRNVTYPQGLKINNGEPSMALAITSRQFVYPAIIRAITATPYWDKSQGLLYNYAAATNRINITTMGEANKEHEIRQGICPTGWHVPSDLEWNTLEETLSPPATANTRGALLKSATRLAGSTTDPAGTSDSENMGGFNILLTGECISRAYPANYGLEAYLWTSSNNNTLNSFFRNLTSDNTGIIAVSAGNSNFLSVRCKRPDMGIRADKDIYHLPSGHDNRGPAIEVIAQIINNFPTKAITVSTPIATTGGGVNLDPALVTSLPVGPTHNLSLTAKTMPTPAPSYPWQSKESKFTLSLTDNPKTKKEITINQTNYALSANGIFEDTGLIISKKNQTSFLIKANARWKATVTDPKGVLDRGISPSATIAPTSGFVSGEDRLNGTSLFGTIYYTPNADNPIKQTTATIKLEDTQSPKRFKDVDVTLFNCLGEDDTNNTLTNGVMELNDTRPQLLGNQKYLYKNYGGIAGTWLLENLRYIPTDGSLQLFDHNVHINVYQSGGLYIFPAPEEPTPTEALGHSSAFLLQNPEIGVLYNWFGVTGGRTEQTDEVDDGSGIDQTPRTQGMCPTGWHVPSSKEWNDLLEHLVKNQTLVQDNPFSNLTYNSSWRNSESEHDVDVYKLLTSPCNEPVYRLLTNSRLSELKPWFLSNRNRMAGGFDMKGQYANVQNKHAVYDDPSFAPVWNNQVGASWTATTDIHGNWCRSVYVYGSAELKTCRAMTWRYGDLLPTRCKMD